MPSKRIAGWEQWLMVDLERTCRVITATVRFEAAWASEFEIHTSIDDHNWTVAHRHKLRTNQTAQMRFREDTTARFVKLVLKTRGDMRHGYGVMQFDVLGTPL